MKQKYMMMRPRSILFHSIANDPKLRITAKVWKVQIKFPCGFCLKEDVVILNQSNGTFVRC
jgi:hypothetical protein